MLSAGNFPYNMKLADTTPVFKKKDPLKNENHRPVSILSAISKIFEKLMQKQIVVYMQDFLSLYLRGCRKNINGHDLLITKLHAYGFRNDNLKLFIVAEIIDSTEQKITINLVHRRS